MNISKYHNFVVTTSVFSFFFKYLNIKVEKILALSVDYKFVSSIQAEGVFSVAAPLSPAAGDE